MQRECSPRSTAPRCGPRPPQRVDNLRFLFATEKLADSKHHLWSTPVAFPFCRTYDVLRRSSAACKALKVLKGGVLKRLASGVQLPPWPPKSLIFNNLQTILNPVHRADVSCKSMIFDIHRPLCPLGLMKGRAQTRRAWRLPLVRLGWKLQGGRSISSASALSRQRHEQRAYS